MTSSYDIYNMTPQALKLKRTMSAPPQQWPRPQLVTQLAAQEVRGVEERAGLAPPLLRLAGATPAHDAQPANHTGGLLGRSYGSLDHTMQQKASMATCAG